MTKEERDAIRQIARTPFLVVCGLLLLFGANLGLSFVALGRFNLVLNLAIAAIMIGLITVIFMELDRANGIQRIAAAIGVFWLFFLFFLGFADYLSR
jgi:cytochrome c oxidase subunit IV